MTRTLFSLSTLGLLAGLALSAGCGDKDDTSTDDTSTDDTSTDDTSAETEDCGNGADDDGDGATDCDDSDCDDAAECQPPAEDCTNGADDDLDGATDCDDSDCADEPQCQIEDDCTNVMDDDGDLLGDCADDDCANDAACTCIVGTWGIQTGENLASGSNSAATDEWVAGEDSCGSTGGLDLTYAFSLPADGCYNVTTEGSDYDTVLRHVSGCGGEEYACNDDASGLGLQSRLTIVGLAGDAVTVVVDGYSSSSSGNYQLNVEAITPPTTEADLGSATGASLASGALSDNGVSGQSACGLNPSPTLIFAWTAPSEGEYTFDTLGSDFDTILGLFDTCYNTEILCNDDSSGGQSSLTAYVGAGEVYYLELSGFNGNTGNYVININPANN